jgi:CheY-like chemotaxis protein
MSARCLIVDDSREFVRVASDLLEQAGLTVVGAASTAVQASLVCSDLHPDVVLVDIDLGDESGFEVARDLVGATGSGHPCIILISAHSADDFADVIADMAGVSFLPKGALSGPAVLGILAAPVAKPILESSRLEIREHCEHASVVVFDLRQLQPGQNAADVLLHGSLGDPQSVRDSCVRASLGHELEHLALTIGELVQAVVAMPGRDELLDEGRVHDRTAVRHSRDRLGELGHVGHPALEQVPDAVSSGQQLHRLIDLGVRGQDEDGRGRELVADLPRRLQALGQVVRRHPDVDDREIGPVRTDQVEQLGSIVSLADDVKPGSGEQTRDACAEQRVVIGQHYALACFVHYVFANVQ